MKSTQIQSQRTYKLYITSKHSFQALIQTLIQPQQEIKFI